MSIYVLHILSNMSQFLADRAARINSVISIYTFRKTTKSISFTQQSKLGVKERERLFLRRKTFQRKGSFQIFVPQV